jgi:hypothetical protein
LSPLRQAGLVDHDAQGTEAEGATAKLFLGKIKAYTRCINMEYESSRLEECYGMRTASVWQV